MTIRIGTFSGGIFNVAGNDVTGPHVSSSNNAPPSDVQLLECLKEVLDLREIPWSDSDLAAIRRVMEAAVEQRNPRLSGLQQALTRLSSICRDVAVGVVSNGAFQLLLRYCG